MTSRGGARRRNNTWFGLQIQRIISDFVCIIKESLCTCNLLSFSFTIYLTDICEHLGNFLGTICKAANKTIHRGSSSGQMSKQMNMEPRSWQHCKGNQNKGRRKRGSGGWGGGGTLWKRRWLEGTRQFTKLKDILSENSRPEWKSYTGPRGRTSERLGSKSFVCRLIYITMCYELCIIGIKTFCTLKQYLERQKPAQTSSSIRKMK